MTIIVRHKIYNIVSYALFFLCITNALFCRIRRYLRYINKFSNIYMLP